MLCLCASALGSLELDTPSQPVNNHHAHSHTPVESKCGLAWLNCVIEKNHFSTYVFFFFFINTTEKLIFLPFNFVRKLYFFVVKSQTCLSFWKSMFRLATGLLLDLKFTEGECGGHRACTPCMLPASAV